MWNWLEAEFIEPLLDLLGSSLLFVLANLSVILGFICAVLIIRRVATERRSPSNTFAWLLLVLLLPFIGVPLYFMFGGRKSRQMARIKSEVNQECARSRPAGAAR